MHPHTQAERFVMSTQSPKLSYEMLHAAVAGNEVALRAVQRLTPAGGAGDKVFPPTYEGGRYATERRIVAGTQVDTVLLDSVPSQANRMELALRNLHDDGRLEMPLIEVDLSEVAPQVQRITTLDAPHRVADAIFRDSLLGTTPFRKSEPGRAFASASARNATSLFELCPTALLFGMWDSTGEGGGMGAKFQRALVSEIVGFDWVPGVRTSSRIDPLQISSGVPIYEDTHGDWTTDESAAAQENGKPKPFGRNKETRGKPSAINHGNVTPSIKQEEPRRDGSRSEVTLRPDGDGRVEVSVQRQARNEMIPVSGGGTISYATQYAVLSLPALRRLRFPLKDGGDHDAARTLLASLALVALAAQHREGYDLRSRCNLLPEQSRRAVEFVSAGVEPRAVYFDLGDALAVYADAVKAARAAGYTWRKEPLKLQASAQFLELIRKSAELHARSGE